MILLLPHGPIILTCFLQNCLLSSWAMDVNFTFRQSRNAWSVHADPVRWSWLNSFLMKTEILPAWIIRFNPEWFTGKEHWPTLCNNHHYFNSFSGQKNRTLSKRRKSSVQLIQATWSYISVVLQDSINRTFVTRADCCCRMTDREIHHYR